MFMVKENIAQKERLDKIYKKVKLLYGTVVPQMKFLGSIEASYVEDFLKDDMPKAMHVFTQLLNHALWLLKPIFWLTYGRFTKNYSMADKFLGNIALPLKEVDKKLLKDETIKKEFWEMFSESYAQGTKAVAYDARADVLKNGWGFDVADIKMPNIHFWHGELDGGVPVSMARVLSKQIEGATFTSFADEGHLSIFVHRVDKILRELKG